MVNGINFTHRALTVALWVQNFVYTYPVWKAYRSMYRVSFRFTLAADNDNEQVPEVDVPSKAIGATL